MISKPKQVQSKTLWLIRHGETDFNAQAKIQGRGVNAPLNQKGLAQANAVAEALHPLISNPASLYASAMTRAHQTAEAIATACGLEVQLSSQLEELNYGIFEGRAFAEVENDLNILNQHWAAGKVDLPPDQGESPQEVLARVDGFIQACISTDPNEHLIFVVHGRVLRILFAEWLNADLSTMHHFEHHNANLNQIRWSDDCFEAIRLNDTKHLEQLK